MSAKPKPAKKAKVAKKPEVLTVKKPTSKPARNSQYDSGPESRLPTVSRLATIAASMANPAESSFDTAKRALDLWKACDGLILSEQVTGKYGNTSRVESAAKENRLLVACGLRPFSVFSGRTDGSVRLNKFLNACKPSPNSKSDTMLENWRAFRRMDLEVSGEIQGLPSKDEGELESVLAEQMKSDRTNGIPVSSLLQLWRRFDAFHERRDKATKSERGRKGGRPKKVL